MFTGDFPAHHALRDSRDYRMALHMLALDGLDAQRIVTTITTSSSDSRLTVAHSKRYVAILSYFSGIPPNIQLGSSAEVKRTIKTHDGKRSRGEYSSLGSRSKRSDGSPNVNRKKAVMLQSQNQQKKRDKSNLQMMEVKKLSKSKVTEDEYGQRSGSRLGILNALT